METPCRRHLGHGRPTGRAVLARQRTYIEAFVEVVDAHRDRDADARRDAVVARMKELVPNENLLFPMELSIDPVLARLAA